AGEDLPVFVVRRGGQVVEVVDRTALLLPGQLRLADRRGQPPVALGAARQGQQVVADRVRDAGLGRGELQGQLRAEDGRQVRVLGGLLVLHRAGEAVVVGDGQAVQAQARGLGDQLGGAARAVEEGEVGV